jgi:hypothetical protein
MPIKDGDGRAKQRDTGYALWVQFARHWHRLAESGACDQFGGVESDRVYRAWLEANRPTAIADFIRRLANAGPFDHAN